MYYKFDDALKHIYIYIYNIWLCCNMNHIYFSSVGLSSQIRRPGSGCTDLSYAPGAGVVSVLILEGSLSSCH